MLKRIYIDNYKSLVNFEIDLHEINLFLGVNGSGKTSVFEVINAIQAFVCQGLKTEAAFNADAITRWQTSDIQTFELEVESPKGIYSYQLAIAHKKEEHKPVVKYERLYFNDNPLLRFEESGDVHLYRDDFTEGASFPADRALSALGAIPARGDNTRLTWFKKRLKHIIIVQIIPPMMEEESAKEQDVPSKYLENYASWHRFLSQDQGMAFELINELREILPGFDYFKFEPVGEKHRLLKVYFKDDQGKNAVGYKFSELSDGQRMLIALYTLLFAARADQTHRYTLCLDEPENFIALSEMQPWLRELYDRCNEKSMQSLIISHHPEFINYLLASPVGCWFERESNRPTRVTRIAPTEHNGLPFSEMIARGWMNA